MFSSQELVKKHPQGSWPSRVTIISRVQVAEAAEGSVVNTVKVI